MASTAESLSYPIHDINASPWLNTTTFSLGTGPFAIRPLTALLPIADPVVEIDEGPHGGGGRQPLFRINRAHTSDSGAVVTGMKFFDIDADGVLGFFDNPIEGWTIRAYIDTNGDGVLSTGETTVAKEASTSADGLYALPDLGAGSYVICEEKRSGYVQTLPSGSACGTTAGVARAGYPVTLSPGAAVSGKDFGNRTLVTVVPAAVVGSKFDDLNGDGERGSGEPGLEGWTIRAYHDSDQDGQRDPDDGTSFSGETQTAADGSYRLTLLAGNSYVICEVLKPGWTQRSPANSACGSTVPQLGSGGHAVSLGNFEIRSNQDFGNQLDQSVPTRVSGRKYNDLNGDGSGAGDPGLENWTIRAYVDGDGDGSLGSTETTVAAQTQTGVTGGYQLTVAPGQSYVVCEVVPAGWQQTAPSPADNECGDTVAGLGDGGHAVSPAAGETLAGRDFGNQSVPTRVSGRKYNDLNGDGSGAGDPGLENWTIRAYVDGNGNGRLDAGETVAAAEATTAVSGAFVLSLPPGDYVLCELAKADWVQTAPLPAGNECGDTVSGLGDGGHAVTVSAGQNLTGKNFGNRRVPGTIVVVKDAVPDSPQDFAFTAGGLTPASFALDDDLDATLPRSRTFSVAPGSGYSVAEAIPTGWQQVSAICSNGSPVTNITVASGETVTCTFTNKPVPTLPTITKLQQACSPVDPQAPIASTDCAPATPSGGSVNVEFGDVLRYTVRVGNPGVTALSGLLIRDTLPAGVKLLGTSQPCGLAPPPSPPPPGTLNCALSPLSAGGSTSIIIDVQVIASGCTIMGTSRRNTLTGNAAIDTICGAGAGDNINAGGGNDTVYGNVPPGTTAGSLTNTAWIDLNQDGSSSGEPSAAVTAASFVGTDGGDLINSQDGNDTVYGQAGQDEISGSNGDDSLNGDAAGDTINGNAGIDKIKGGDAGDVISGGTGNDIIDGDDSDSTSPGADTINGDDGNDTISGYDRSDEIHGGNGIDTIFGGTGNDTIQGDDGNDYLAGDEGNDLLDGGADNDQLLGGANRDALFGSTGWDRLAGGGGTRYNDETDDNRDLLDGGEGNDLLLGQGGNDTGSFNAGANDQSFVAQLQGGPGADRIHGGTDDGNDRLDGGGPAVTRPPSTDVNNILVGGPGNDFCSYGPIGNYTFRGVAYNYNGTDRGDIRDDSCEDLTKGKEQIAAPSSTNPNGWVFSKYSLDNANIPALFNWANFAGQRPPGAY